MGGKRQANVLSALIQNFDTVENVIETSANSAGSALKENERYLDSIQGKIDQFNNAMQAMWSDTLDSDMVKNIVEIGTEIIKLIDEVGLLPTVLSGAFLYFTVFKKNNPITFIKDIGESFVNAGVQAQKYGASLNGLAIQQQAAKMAAVGLTQQEIAAQLVKQNSIEQNKAEALAEEAVTAAKIKQNGVTAQQVLSAWAENKVSISAQAADWLEKQSTEALTHAKLQEALVSGAITKQDYLEIAAKYGLLTATESLKLGVHGLGATVKAAMASNPIGWIMMAISAVVMLVQWISTWKSTTEKLEEKLSNLNSEINSIEGEIESLNDELETTQDRMSELLAMDSLSFVEQEELKNLQLQTAELERQVELQEILLKAKEKERAETAKKWIGKTWNGESVNKQYAVFGNGTIGEDTWLTSGVSGKDALQASLPIYAKLREETVKMEDAYALAKQELEETGELTLDTFKKVYSLNPNNEGSAEKVYSLPDWLYGDDAHFVDALDDVIKSNNSTIDNMEDGIGLVLGDMSKIISENELSYSMGDEDVNKFLDEYFAYQYAYQEAQGISAKSSAIASIFDDTSSDSIKKLKKDLSEIVGDDTLDAAKKQENALTLVNEAINSTSGEYDRLKTSMDIVGITADEVARYFTQMSSMPDSSTVEGLTAQYQKGVETLSKYQGVATNIIAEFTDLDGTVEQITWGSLFDDDGEVIDTQISKVLQGTNETARAEFARIVKSVNEGTMSIEQAMSSFSGSGLVSVSKLIEESFGELNKSVFKGLEDEISGFIDTFSEFSAALEDVASSMDLLHTAQEQYNNSGQVSVKTALELMQSTDQWNKILTVENGKITLNAEAQDILVQSKLNTVQANLAEAKSSIQNQLAQLGAADATLLSAEASDITTEAYTIYTNAMNSYTASIAGFGAAIDALVNGRIFGDDGIIGSFQSAYDATKQVTTYENNTNIAALREKLAEVDQMEDFFEGVDTFDEFANNYDFDEKPGDKYGNDEDSKTDEKMDAFQRDMDYWENRIGANQAKYEQVQHEIDMLESQGRKAGAKYYQEQINLENQRLDLLKQQKAEAQKYLDQIAAEGNEGSEEWWEVANTINDIEGELDDVTASIVDLNDAMADTHWYMFDEAHDRLSTLTSDLENIRDILSNEELFDDEGNFTKEGLGTLASYVQELGVYEGALASAKAEMELFGDAYDPNRTYVDAHGNDLSIDSEQDWYEAAEKAEEKYDEWNQKVIETRYNIKDLYEQQIDAVEEYTSTLVENYQEYIDVTKEALDAERDLYEFKKSTEQKSKNIASIERRIASLSGSTNAADVAERRKLQAELTDAKSDMDDHYYSHSKDQQSQALDDEATAYETAMNAFIESLYTKLEESTTGLYMSYEEMSTETKSFVDGVTESVVLNAGNVKDTYLATGETIDDCLMTPWTNAAAAIGTFASSEDALGLMNSWTESKAGAPFYDFQTKVSGYLSKPWSTIIAEGGPVKTFKTSVNSVMSQIVSDVQSNVSGISGVVSNLQTEIDKIKDTTIRITTVYETQGDLENYNGGGGDEDPPEKAKTMHADGQLYARTVVPTNLPGMHKTVGGVTYVPIPGTNHYVKKSDAPFGSAPYGTTKYKYYAKGTTGTTRDEWAITDESKFGDELVLVPGKDGNLSFMRKGTGVVPADMTQKLFELAQIPTSDLMNKNLTAIVPNITKNDFKNEFNFESLVHVDTVDSDTLPKLEKMVDKKIDDFSKALNYSLKRFAR